jgi:biopolymer transport protein ExbD
MSAIKEITVKVPSDVAEAYNRATESQRQQIAVSIGTILTLSMGDKEEKITLLKQKMNDISAEAAANGLTAEILESILNEHR